jgi:hypothetical protein
MKMLGVVTVAARLASSVPIMVGNSMYRDHVHAYHSEKKIKRRIRERPLLLCGPSKCSPM